MLACLRHAPVSEGCVVALSRGLRPLATFGDPFGIEVQASDAKVEFEKSGQAGSAYGEFQFCPEEVIKREGVKQPVHLQVELAVTIPANSAIFGIRTQVSP